MPDSNFEPSGFIYCKKSDLTGWGSEPDFRMGEEVWALDYHGLNVVKRLIGGMRITGNDIVYYLVEDDGDGMVSGAMHPKTVDEIFRTEEDAKQYKEKSRGR